MEFLDLITQRPIVLQDDKAACPHCQCEDLTYHGGWSTSLGWAGTGADPNHRVTEYSCRGCGERFTREVKSDNVWYVDAQKKCLKGVSNCFERCDYTCASCGGTVTREYRNLDGSPHHGVGLSSVADASGKLVPQYLEVYVCRGCGLEAQR